MALVEARSLAKTYGDGHRALDGVDLDLDVGMVGVLGPNGAGKTTLLSMLVLAREPTSGSRSYAGLDAARAANRPRIRALLGYLPQDFSPIGHLTGAEYVEHCARLRGVPGSRAELRRQVRELLESVGLTAAAARRSGEYSGGMKRRLGIAQAMIHRPRVLVVDEPTAGLDPEERIRFRNLVTDISADTAVVLSTHVVEDIEATCPRLVVIAAGRKLFDGEPGTLMREAAPRLHDVPAGVPLPPDALVLGVRSGAGASMLQIVDSGAPIAGARLREPTLEDAYASFLARRGYSHLDPEA